MLPPRGAEMLDRFLRRQHQAQHVEVELLVEVLGGDVFQRGELVDAGVVDQDVELAERLLRLGEQPSGCPPVLADVGLHGDGLAALAW